MDDWCIAMEMKKCLLMLTGDEDYDPAIDTMIQLMQDWWNADFSP